MRNKAIIGSALAGLVASIAFAGMFMTHPPAAAAETATDSGFQHPQRTLSVVGTATAKVAPDQINISFAVENQEKTAQEATQANAGTTNAVIEALKGAGLSEQEIGTSYYSVYPVYNYTSVPVDCIQYGGDQAQKYCPPPAQAQILVGYKAVNSIQVQSAQLDQAGGWIDAAVQAGANRVDNLYFTVSADKQDEIRHGLIADAVQNARSKATTAAQALGVDIAGVLSVNIDSYPIIYQKRGYEYAAGAGAPSTNIIAGIQDISVTVPVTFEISGSSGGGSGSNSTIEAAVNQQFNLTLDSNPSTGYKWQVARIDETAARLVNDEYVPPASGMLGASGKQVLTFEALKEGTTSIELKYVRPWEPDKPASTYHVDVVISANP